LPVPAGAGRGGEPTLDTGYLMLDKSEREFLFQYPETSIWHHVLSTEKHGIFQKLDTNVKMFVFEDS
jgi:hypothetical protein